MAPFTQMTDNDRACFTQGCVAFPFNLKQTQQLNIRWTGKKAMIMKHCGPETGPSPCCSARILHRAVVWRNAGTPCPSPPDPAHDRVAATRGYCWISTLGLGRRKALLCSRVSCGPAKGSRHQALVQKTTQRPIFPRVNPCRLKYHAPSQEEAVSSFRTAKRLFTTKYFKVTWLNVQKDWTNELPAYSERHYKSRKADFEACWSDGTDHDAEQRTGKPKSIGFTAPRPHTMEVFLRSGLR